MGVQKDSELGSDGDIDGRRASSSLVVGREVGDFAGGLGTWIIGWGRGSPARHQPVTNLSVAPGVSFGTASVGVLRRGRLSAGRGLYDDEADELPVDEEASSGCMVSIELHHGRTLRLPSTLPCHEIQRLIAAVEAA